MTDVIGLSDIVYVTLVLRHMIWVFLFMTDILGYSNIIIMYGSTYTLDIWDNPNNSPITVGLLYWDTRPVTTTVFGSLGYGSVL